MPRAVPCLCELPLAALLCALALLWPARGQAEDVTRTIDADGVVHISISGRAERPARRRSAEPRYAPDPPRGHVSADRAQIERIIAEAADYYKLPPALVKGVVRVESNFYPRAVSRVGALGLMQLMPRTARAMHVRDPFDPRDNVFGGCRYLRLLINRFDGDVVLALAAYNAGEGAVVRRRGIPYTETAGYVRNVLRHYDRYRRQEQGEP